MSLSVMKPKICCTFIVERSDSPALPCAKTIDGLSTAHTRKTVDSPLTGSRYTSVRTEDLRDIQRIFQDAQINNENAGMSGEGKISLKSSPRKSLMGSLFRKTLTHPRSKSLSILLSDRRPRSKSAGNLLSDPSQLQRAKGEIRKALFSDQGPEAGGYDADASIMGDVDESVSQEDVEESPTRGRNKARSQDVGSVDWPQRKLRVSNSLSLPRISLNLDTLTLRRSFSVGSNGSMPDAKARLKLRLPQLSVNSRHWKRSVMESLQISSPSMSILPAPELSGKDVSADCPLWVRNNSKQLEKRTFEMAPRLSLMEGSFDQPFDSTHQSTHTPKQSVESTTSTGVKNALHQRGEASTSGSDRPLPSHCLKRSTGESKLVIPNMLDRRNHGKQRTSTVSVHLQNMRISHHLRSESSVSSAAGTAVVPTTASTRMHTPIQSDASVSVTIPLPPRVARRRRRSSRSAFSLEGRPEQVTNPVTSLTCNSSSVYSQSVASPMNSPAGSILHIPRPSLVEYPEQVNACPIRNLTALLPSTKVMSTPPDKQSTPQSDESQATISDCAEDAIMPANLSSSNLSKGSKSSKTSRFKENFDTVDTKRSTKRSSIVNLFTKSITRRAFDVVSSLDGSGNDHGSVQRATPLSERQDAVGLFSKAIKAQQAEKSSMYLSPNKDRAEFEMVRKRSTSFSHYSPVSRGKEHTGDNVLSPGSSVLSKCHNPVETPLRPDFYMPDFAGSSRDALKQNQSTSSTLKCPKPEFSLPVFSNVNSSSRARSSVALDPMEKRALALHYGVESDDDFSKASQAVFPQNEQKLAWSDIEAMLPVRPIGLSLTVQGYLAEFRKANSWTPDGSEPAVQSLSETLRIVLNSQVKPPLHVRYDADFSVEQLLYALVALRTDNGQPPFPDEMFEPLPGISLSPAAVRPKVPSFELNDRPVLIDSPTETQGPAITWATSLPNSPSRRPTVEDVDDLGANLGSWSRYPSHTRGKRTGSAGQADQVKTYDFAYHINPQNIATDSSSADDKSPKERGSRKKSKKNARMGLPKSKSMMIGRDFIRNYSRLIRAPSVEWLNHGKGHRSSISAGGSLSHPELEVLPPVFAAYPNPIPEADEEDPALADFQVHKDTFEMQDMHSTSRNDPLLRLDGSAELGERHEREGLMSEQEKHAASSPDLLIRNSEKLGSEDEALRWSRHYESCVELPRKSSFGHSKVSTDTSPAVSSATASGLIDAMLACSSGSNSGFGSETSSALPRKIHAKHGKMDSVTSIRASSMDLLKKLAEAENREKMRCSELLMNGKKAVEEGEFLAMKSLMENSVREEQDSGEEVIGGFVGPGGPVQPFGNEDVMGTGITLTTTAAV